jgi:hypothetical protein
MGKFTASQVEAAINAEFDIENYFYEEIDPAGTFLSELDAYAYKISSEGGYEGGGDYMDVVFKVGDQLFKKTGYYNSWDSNEWDGGLEEVESYEEVVVKYRSKKG